MTTELDRLIELIIIQHHRELTDLERDEWKSLKSQIESKLAQADNEVRIGKECLDLYASMIRDYEHLAPYKKDFVDLFLDQIVKGTCNDCGETKPCPKHSRENTIRFYGDSHEYLRKELDQIKADSQELSQLREENQYYRKAMSKICKDLSSKYQSMEMPKPDPPIISFKDALAELKQLRSIVQKIQELMPTKHTIPFSSNTQNANLATVLKIQEILATSEVKQ